MPSDNIDRTMFGRRIAAARKYRGYSQKEVAELVGVSQPTYSDYENGKTLMGLDNFARVARALNVSADWILGLPQGEGRGPV